MKIVHSLKVLKYPNLADSLFLIFEIPITALLFYFDIFEIFGTNNSLENRRITQHWFGPIIMHIIQCPSKGLVKKK